jgi:hypothetical protein
MRMMLAALLPLAMACAAMPDEAEPVGGPGDRCDASTLGNLVGRDATQELGAEALRRSSARVLRWIRPGDVVTMDYREDRLNIHLDGRNRVERFACG